MRRSLVRRFPAGLSAARAWARGALAPAALLVALGPSLAAAQSVSSRAGNTARDTGVSAIWILANFSYAGMRAQGSESRGWRIVAFLFGLPGTLVSFFAVPEGEERAYGVELPRGPRGPGGVP